MASFPFLVGTTNTSHIYTLSFTTPKPGELASLQVIKKADTIGSHSWLHLQTVNSKRVLYATAWTEPPSLVAYDLSNLIDIKAINKVTTATRSGYVSHPFEIISRIRYKFFLWARGRGPLRLMLPRPAADALSSPASVLAYTHFLNLLHVLSCRHPLWPTLIHLLVLTLANRTVSIGLCLQPRRLLRRWRDVPSLWHRRLHRRLCPVHKSHTTPELRLRQR